MTDQDRINSILAAIASDATLLTLMRALIAKNIGNVPSDNLVAMQIALGLPTQ